MIGRRPIEDYKDLFESKFITNPLPLWSGNEGLILINAQLAYIPLLEQFCVKTPEKD